MLLVFNEETRRKKQAEEKAQHPNRVFERVNVLKSAAISYGEMVENTVECVVTDISKQGARILVSSAEAIPANFKLTFANGNTEHSCVLAWSTKDEIGVRFID